VPVTTERIALGGFNSTGLRVERLPPPIGIRTVKFPAAPPRQTVEATPQAAGVPIVSQRPNPPGGHR
jgi:hypothetical protein